MEHGRDDVLAECSGNPPFVENEHGPLDNKLKLRRKGSQASIKQKRKPTPEDAKKFEELRKNDPSLDRFMILKMEKEV